MAALLSREGPKAPALRALLPSGAGELLDMSMASTGAARKLFIGSPSLDPLSVARARRPGKPGNTTLGARLRRPAVTSP